MYYFYDLILRSAPIARVSKDGSEHGMRNFVRRRCLWPSFETAHRNRLLPISTSMMPKSGRPDFYAPPQDEVVQKNHAE
jgi:hypothetical protein